MTKPKLSLPESYIIRIYRRDPDDPALLVGTLQSLECTQPLRQFHTGNELLAWLAGDEPPAQAKTEPAEMSSSENR